jgi:hypothetical protein
MSLLTHEPTWTPSSAPFANETLSRIATTLKDREPISNGVLERQREGLQKRRRMGSTRVGSRRRRGREPRWSSSGAGHEA